jgi:hypothetical protein
VNAVKDVTGHTDISTTMRYVHAIEEGKRKVVEAAANWGKKEKKGAQARSENGRAFLLLNNLFE